MPRCFLFLLLTAGTLRPVCAGDTFSQFLFDENSLAGLVVENECQAELKDGVLLLKSGDGWLRSHHTYGDFKLHVEWKALQEKLYDAGIYIRAQAGGKPFPKQAHQINLLEGKEGHIGGLKGATTSGLIKNGDWNTFDVTVEGDSVALEINGKPAYRAKGLKYDRGHVGVQVEVPKGGQFLIRKFTVTEFGHKSLFNGKDLAHWEGAGGPAEKCWAVEDGTIFCKQQKGPWLRHKQQVGDFNLRFDYRVGPGGNSGVYVRVPANGLHHRDKESEPPAGFEIQILDDSAAKYRKLKPYQFSASLYDIAGANPRVCRPPGEWNSMEIDCHGQHVTVIHNGMRVVNVQPKTHPLINLRKTEGYIGLQNHGGGVWFRDVRIRADKPSR